MIDDTGSYNQDIIINGNHIEAAGQGLGADADTTVIDITGMAASLGLADVHVHLRVPGNPEKETIATGTSAAAAGGFTSICSMPNLIPVPDSLENLRLQQDLIEADAVIDVRPFATITAGRAGRKLADIENLAKIAVGFSDDGNGVQDRGLMYEAMQRIADADSILAAHCEDNTLLHRGYIHKGDYCLEHGHRGICSESEWRQIERDLVLAGDTGCRYHVCHISTAESVELIRDAKASGIKATCETGPHYLTFTDADLREEGRFKMNPPLRSLRDKEALIAGIADGTIDCIATDHAPHTREEKSRGLEKSLMGVVGLETAFGASYTSLVKTGIIGLERLWQVMCGNPRRIFRLGGSLKPGSLADVSVFDINRKWTVSSETFRSKGKATPFDGMELTGHPCATFYHGKPVY